MTKRIAWFYSLFVALLYTAVYGYLFNSGDQAEHLPQVYHRLNPNLYPGDFFIHEYMKSFTIRDYYVAVVAFLSHFTTTEWVCFTLHLLTLVLSNTALIRISQTLSNNRFTPYIAPVLAFIVFRDFTVGGNAVLDTQFISSSFAVPLVLFGFYKLLQEKYIWAGFYSGIACLAQPLIGLQGFMLILGVIILRNKRIRFGHIVYTIMAFTFGAALMLSPLIIRQFLTPGNVDSNLYLELLYGFRNYTHYIPHLFPKTDYVKFGLLLAIGAFLLYKNKSNAGKSVQMLFVVALAGLLVYTICMETHTLYGIGKMQWYKTTVWLSLFSSILVAISLGNWLDKVLSKRPLPKLSHNVKTVLVTIPSIALFTFITNSAMAGNFHEKYQVGNYVKSDRTKLLEWVEQNTPIEAVVLVSPDDDSFACIAKRTQPISFKAIIHEPGFMLPWYKRVQEVYGITIENTRDKKPLTEATSLYKERNYKEHITAMPIAINYRIDNAQQCQYIDSLGTIIHREGDWLLTQF